MSWLKDFIRGNRHLFLFSLTVVTLLRLIRVRLQTFPLPSGWSKFDFIPRRSKLNTIPQNYTQKATPNTNALLNALQDDRVRIDNLLGNSLRSFPISFSWPGSLDSSLVELWEKREAFSKVIPGEPYSFFDYPTYLRQYQNSKFAITIKKGGWDCFRHVEILASGCVPIMPDVKQCPEWAMEIYPKAAMAEVLSHIVENREISQTFVHELYRFFEDYLTSEAMARFLLKRVGFSGGQVIFLDPYLNTAPEYLSVSTYVGLKQILGRDGVTAPFGADPIFKGWSGNHSLLHGLGFGYTNLLDTALMSPIESARTGDLLSTENLEKKNLVIIGSLSRNQELANRVNQLEFQSSNVLYLWGDDRSPNRQEIKWLKQLRGFIAFRELHGGQKTAKYLEQD